MRRPTTSTERRCRDFTYWSAKNSMVQFHTPSNGGGGLMRLVNWAGLAVAVLAGGPLAIGQTQDDFFDNTYVHEFRLVLKASDWDTLRRLYDRTLITPP